MVAISRVHHTGRTKNKSELSTVALHTTKVNLLAGHYLEMTGKQINLNLKNRKTNRLLSPYDFKVLRFYFSERTDRKNVTFTFHFIPRNALVETTDR